MHTATTTNEPKEVLYSYQIDAANKMRNGCILNGGVGSGKSRTALYYFCKEYGASTDGYSITRMTGVVPDLYIITTAMKRNTKEWEKELPIFLLNNGYNELYSNNVVIDSWNNIKKYVDVKNAFFMFDEDHVTGKGQWVKSFLKISKHNRWVILSATPGDTWEQYIPVFVANGFYRNASEFKYEHIVYAPYTKFPKIERYLNTQKLNSLRNSILINMDFKRSTKHVDLDVFTDYSRGHYKMAIKDRINPITHEPILNPSELGYVLRRIANDDPSRYAALLDILKDHPRIVLFYNFDYELEALKELFTDAGYLYAEWNGHVHEPVPEGDGWVFLVQYNAGAEGWNCITTDTMVFFSLNNSYKTMVQASGRIDRLNTKYSTLYYYHLKSKASIDLAIDRTLRAKKEFNQNKWCKTFFERS